MCSVVDAADAVKEGPARRNALLTGATRGSARFSRGPRVSQTVNFQMLLNIPWKDNFLAARSCRVTARAFNSDLRLAVQLPGPGRRRYR